MKSVLNCGLLVIALISFVISAGVASAAESQVCDAKIDKGYVYVMKGTGTAARNPTLEELFDAFNSTKTLFADLKWVDGREHQPELHIEVSGKASYYIDFQSVPDKGIKDPRCSKIYSETVVKGKSVKKQIDETGYECRLRELRAKPLVGSLPNGIKTGVEVKIPETDMDLVSRVSKAFGCGEMLEESGQPVLPAKTSPPAKKSPAKKVGKQVPSATVDQPVDESGPLLGKPRTNVIPAIQLQAVPKATAK